MENQIIYADNAATTPLSPSAMEAMLPWLCEDYGNASTAYSLGRKSRKAVESARDIVAECLGCNNRETFFTSGGSESDNWAIRGAALYMKKFGKDHIITSSFEHHAVLHTCAALEQEGFRVTYLPISENGILETKFVREAICEGTGLVTIMYANNEIGTVQPVEEIGALCRSKNILFHTDAVQAAGHLPIHVKKQNIDLLSISGHKFHGPKGVGALYIREGLALSNLIHGGAQESGHRAGTENTAGIVGMATALKESCELMQEANSRLIGYRDLLRKKLLAIPGSRWNGDLEKRLPGNSNFSFSGIEGEALLLMLDMQGICVSSGSACTTGEDGPSHVLKAIGLSDQDAKGSLRVTLDRQNTEEEVLLLAEKIENVVTHLRSMDPFNI